METWFWIQNPGYPERNCEEIGGEKDGGQFPYGTGERLINIFIYTALLKHLIYISLFPAEISIVLFNEPLMNSLRRIT